LYGQASAIITFRLSSGVLSTTNGKPHFHQD
jgi:hypothetical protein